MCPLVLILFLFGLFYCCSCFLFGFQLFEGINTQMPNINEFKLTKSF